jgi:hypothetical protein
MHFQNQSESKKLSYGPPECIDQLEQLFQHVFVDGSNSCITGQHFGHEEEQ